MTEQENLDAIYDQVRGILGEHFHNFCFIVMEEDGDLFCDYTNYRVGRMLMTESMAYLDADFKSNEWEWPGESEEGDENLV